MRRLLVVLALCALPAQGGNLATDPSDDELNALTPIDTIVTRDTLDRVLQGNDLTGRIARLRDIAMFAKDPGVRLRAVRALPVYCSATCRSDGESTGDPAHLAIREVLASLDPADHSGRAVVQLRAAVEALGATKSTLAEDVTLIVQVLDLLDHPSRDVRATAARALGQLCSKAAETPLQDHTDRIEQVGHAISAALDALQKCGQ